MLLGFGTSWPGAMPVPDSDAVSVTLESLLDIAIVPVTVPVEVGVKTTSKVALWPAATVSGREGELRENSEALVLAPVIVTEVVLLFVAVAVSVLVLPTTTLPKLSVEELNPKSPFAAGC
jgi:hypothetical protein